MDKKNDEQNIDAVKNESPVALSGTVENETASPSATTENYDVGENLGIDVNPKKKKKGLAGVIAIIAVLVLGAGLYFVYKGFTENPTEIIKKVIENAYKDFSADLKEVDQKTSGIDILNEPVKMTGEISYNTDTFKGLDKEKVAYDLGLDYKKKMAVVGGALLKDGSNLVDGKIYLKNNKMYMKSDTLFNNTYALGEQKFDELFDFQDLEDTLKATDVPSVDDIDYIVREFKNALVASLDSKKMILEKGNLDIEGKSVKTNKITYKLDNEAMMNLSNSIIKKVLENDELVSKLADLTGEAEEDVEEALEAAIIEDESDIDDFDGDFVLYTTGINYKVVKMELVSGNEKITLSSYDDKMRIVIDTTEFKGELASIKNGNAYDVTLSVNGSKIVVLKVREFDDEKIDLDYDIDAGGVKLEGALKINVDNKKSGELKGEVDATLEITQDREKANYSLNFTFDLLGNASLEDIDTTKALTDVTEEDYSKLMTKLEELESSALYNYISGNTDLDLGL